MKHWLAPLILLALLSSCKGVGLSQLDMEEAPGPQGLAPALETESPEDKAKDKWFKGFYGTSKSEEQKDKDWWGGYYGQPKEKGTNSLGW